MRLKILFLSGLFLFMGEVAPSCADLSGYSFTIITPPEAIAGKPFLTKIIAKDESGIVATDYAKVGPEVEITTTGTGRISPALIAPEEFKQGVAAVNFVYDKAESFTIIATARPAQEKERLKPKVALADLKKELESHYQAGRRYLGRKDYPKAKAEFTKVVELDVNYKNAAKYLVHCQEALAKQKAKLEISARRKAQEAVGKYPEEEIDVGLFVEKKAESEILAQPQPQPKAIVKEYTIGEEDVLDISVWEWEDLHTEVIVRPDGRISFPLVGDIQAEGMTLSQLDEELTEKLKVYIRQPQVSVIVRKFGGKKAIILGEVSNPGVYRATGKNTIMEVVALAGGFTDDAVLSSIILIRGDLRQPQARKVDLNRVIKEGDLSENVAVQPEDIIYVPRKVIANINYFLSQITPTLEKTNFFKGWERQW